MNKAFFFKFPFSSKPVPYLFLLFLAAISYSKIECRENKIDSELNTIHYQVYSSTLKRSQLKMIIKRIKKNISLYPEQIEFLLYKGISEYTLDKWLDSISTLEKGMQMIQNKILQLTNKNLMEDKSIFKLKENHPDFHLKITYYTFLLDEFKKFRDLAQGKYRQSRYRIKLKNELIRKYK